MQKTCPTWKVRQMHHKKHPQDSVMVERRWLREKPRDLQFIPARKKRHLQNPSKLFKTMEKGMLSRCRWSWCNLHERIYQHSNRAMVACVESLIWSQKSLQQKPCCRLPMERRLQEKQEIQIITSCISWKKMIQKLYAAEIRVWSAPSCWCARACCDL